MTANPACWAWGTEVPTEDTARHKLLAHADRIGCTPEQAEILWSLERAAGALDGESVLINWQAGRCAVCGHVRDLVCDHDHATGLVRGWLCRSCNTTEGTNQNPDTIFARYRERHPAAILGVTIRYLNPVTGDYAKPQLTREVGRADRWVDAASEDIGL
ncbi:endonuclease domain-containing protein [Streptomyces sp. DSM 44915]|uniref:Endonuclease domain-containing protein n=1 Tax=Streptomyces chisholmiae TaxID=3075540 RepID=A0ABU2K031_9ACTN|nr:endonuclease domain-containing protein [Streptomyces sp. DSM 44915]MDT0270597.1 endonuclease domain-containing protein [Streptomyces sp. DSM 44915]